MKNANNLKTFTPSLFGSTTVASKGATTTTTAGGTFSDDGTVYTPPFNPNPPQYTTTTTAPESKKGLLSKEVQIIDVDGKPLAGAHLVWKDGKKNVGTTTDSNGFATVTVPIESTKISISFVGKRSHVAAFRDLGQMIGLQNNVDNLPPVTVGTEKEKPDDQQKPTKTNYLKVAGISIAALLIIGAIGGEGKKSKGLNAPKPKKRKKGKKSKKRKAALREPAPEITL